MIRHPQYHLSSPASSNRKATKQGEALYQKKKKKKKVWSGIHNTTCLLLQAVIAKPQRKVRHCINNKNNNNSEKGVWLKIHNTTCLLLQAVIAKQHSRVKHCQHHSSSTRRNDCKVLYVLVAKQPTVVKQRSSSTRSDSNTVESGIVNTTRLLINVEIRTQNSIVKHTSTPFVFI